MYKLQHISATVRCHIDQHIGQLINVSLSSGGDENQNQEVVNQLLQEVLDSETELQDGVGHEGKCRSSQE